MSRHTLARHLRAVLACVAIAMAWPSPATLTSTVEGIAWIAGTDAVEAMRVEANDPACCVPAPTGRSVAKHRQAAQAVPAGARAIVVRRRVYLDHEALLC